MQPILENTEHIKTFLFSYKPDPEVGGQFLCILAYLSVSAPKGFSQLTFLTQSNTMQSFMVWTVCVGKLAALTVQIGHGPLLDKSRRQ